MAIEESDVFRFEFSGGLADNRELNFYECSRSQYAAARLLYTVARYQETGRVVARISEKTVADFRIRAPQPGSFIYDALLFLAAEGSKAAVSVPLRAIFTMVWDRMLSNANHYIGLKTEAILELRRLELKTKPQLHADELKRLEILREVQHDKELTKRELINLARDLLQQQELRPDAPVERVTSLRVISDDLQLELSREEVMGPHFSELAKISDEDRRKLFSKARPLVAEIGLPLRTSAKELSVGVGKEHKRIAWLNPEKVAEISELEADEAMDRLRGQVIQYNRETGYGRFKLEEGSSGFNEYGREVPFRILRPMKEMLNIKIIDAMKEAVVIGEFMVTRDKEGKPKSLLLIELRDVTSDHAA